MNATLIKLSDHFNIFIFEYKKLNKKSEIQTKYDALVHLKLV